ncbi:hypothetical protein D9M69_709510 [compost metagenome]
MAACGYLRHDATVDGMDIDLRVDDIRKKLAAIFNDGRSCFVTTALNSQDFHLLIVYQILTIGM